MTAKTAATKKSATKAKVETPEAITAYKAFDKNLQCRGFQYEIGKTFEHTGNVALCNAGFHSCTDPLDVLNYYDITDSRFAIVKASGAISRQSDGDSKIASASLHIEAELTLPDFIKRAIKAVSDACKVKASDAKVDGGVTKGHSATNASSGHSAKNASSGDSATNASSGHSATNASSGDSATNASSGHYATNASSGHSATNASSGHYAKNASSGHYAKNASSGDFGSSEATGEHAVISAAGRETRAKGAKGVWISLAEYSYDSKLGRHICIGFATGQVGHDDVPADTWLIAKGGKLVAA